jgi:hypothetical protein
MGVWLCLTRHASLAGEGSGTHDHRHFSASHFSVFEQTGSKDGRRD